jgi:hypothetical protein
MMLRPLILADQQRADIKRVMDHANVHRYSVQDMFDLLGGRRNPPGDDPNYVCVIPNGYRCVYTIEQLEVGLCRHLSVSVMGTTSAVGPSPEALLMLMTAFGFIGGFESLTTMAKEDLGDGALAISVIQKL